MTLGDVLAVIAAVLTIGAAWAATILLVALAFPARAARAETQLTASPGLCLARGLGTVLAAGLLAALCWGAAAGPARLLSGLLLGGLGTVAAVGSAAMTRLLAGRIDAMGSPMAPFASLTRASGLYVASGFLPVVGWFFVMPVALLLAVGSGVAALWPEKNPKPAAYSPSVLAEPTQ